MLHLDSGHRMAAVRQATRRHGFRSAKAEVADGVISPAGDPAMLPWSTPQQAYRPASVELRRCLGSLGASPFARGTDGGSLSSDGPDHRLRCRRSSSRRTRPEPNAIVVARVDDERRIRRMPGQFCRLEGKPIATPHFWRRPHSPRSTRDDRRDSGKRPRRLKDA